MLPREIAGKYEYRGKLGSGAMGRVYEAVDRNIERRVAIKLVELPGSGDPEAAEAHVRFRREAQAAGRLAHPNIIGVYDYGENDGQAWIIMELVEGGSLKDRLDRQERFTIQATARILEQVLGALAYSHARGVVHRDIKPANIMLTEGPDGALQVKLADFGIARLENSSMTQVGTLMGTPSYMAPEQLRGEPVDMRADIWGAGVVLYQLLTGEKPFEGGFSAVLHKALNTDPTPPSVLAVSAPRAFDAVVARAMAKRPEDRFPDAASFAEAIRDAVRAPTAAEPAIDVTMVAAPRPPQPATAPTPAAMAPNRRRSPAALIGGALLAAAALGAGGWWLLSPGPDDGAVRREARRAEAEQQAQAAAEAIRRHEVHEPVPPPAEPQRPAAAPSEAPVSAPAPVPAAPAPLPVQAAPPPAQSPPVVPEPVRDASPAQQRQMLQAAAAAALTAEPCSLLRATETAAGMTIAGPIRRGGEAAVRAALLSRGVPEQAFQMMLEAFDGPYCDLLAVVRRHVPQEAAAPQVAIRGTLPLVKDDLLRMTVTMPGTPGQFSMSYVTVGGEVGHMIPGRPEPANARLLLGDPATGFPGWAVDEPFGTDLLLVFASEQPIFAERRPTVELLASYVAALGERLRELSSQGRRIGIRAMVVETAPWR